MKITIKIFEGEKEITSKVFRPGVYRIGRSEFSDVLLDHATISRSHVEIRVTTTSVYLTNMAPAGRVKRNGVSVETAEISDGDEVMVGPFRIIIYLRESAPPSPEPPSPQPPSPEPSPEPPSPEISPEISSEQENPLFQLKTEVELKPVIAKVLFLEGPRSGDEVRLDAYEATMGRSHKTDIFIDDEKLSRVHAKITRIGMGYRLIDLNSKNGTFVNGVRILEHPLSSFDQIELGSSKMRFLIQDLMAGEFGKNQLTKVEGGENTHSLMAAAPKAIVSGSKKVPKFGSLPNRVSKLNKRQRNLLYGACLMLLLVFYFMVSRNEKKPEIKPSVVQTVVDPNIPKEYASLTPEGQRTIEGYYNMALRLADKDSSEEALAYLKRIHETIPFYKNSREIQEQLIKKVKDLQIARAKADAQKNEKRDLALYLEDGLEYLKDGDFGRAEEALNSALLLEPENQTAIKGLKAVEQKVRRLEDIAPERNPEEEKRKLVASLFEQAILAFNEKSYARTIQIAEDIRKVELKGDTQYLSEAKQLIDKARKFQVDQFEPFLLQAKEKFVEGDFKAVRDLTAEMLKQDPTYQDAIDLQKKVLRQLNNLAKEAYTQGYVLESMNRIEDAKQYWNRAKNYVRPGDPYYDKIMKKLEQYQ